jgi:hypothetical protein
MGAFARWVSFHRLQYLLCLCFSVLLPNGCHIDQTPANHLCRDLIGKTGLRIDLLYLACLATMILGGTGRLFAGPVLRQVKNRRQRNMEHEKVDGLFLMSKEMMQICSADPDDL